MAFEISFSNLTADQKAACADLMQKIEAIDAALAEIQTTRATKEAAWIKKETYLKQQKDNIKDQIRAIRTATVTETV